MISRKFSLIAIAASLALFFFGGSAHALTVDMSTLDTMHTESHGPFGTLNWSGVSIEITKQFSGGNSAQIQIAPDARLDGGTYLSLQKPETNGISRIVKGKDGALSFEHADLLIDSIIPTLQITAFSSVKLVEVARLDPKVDRGKSVPIYAYRVDAAHVALLVGADGQSIGKRDAESEGSCAQNGQKCVFDSPVWNDHMVSLTLGKDSQVAQARGDIVFDDAPNGATNDPLTYIVNASYTQSSRDPAPLLAISLHTMPTIFRGDSDGE
ncbi:MAG: hypothetical protein ABI183_10225 [Polyangiaceae bacterium]